MALYRAVLPVHVLIPEARGVKLTACIHKVYPDPGQGRKVENVRNVIDDVSHNPSKELYF